MTKQYDAVVNKGGSVRTLRVEAQSPTEAKKIAETMLGLSGSKSDSNGRVTSVRYLGRK